MAVVTSLAAVLEANAAEPADVRREFLAGNYSLALAETEGGLRSSPGNVDWQILRVEALLATGHHDESRARQRSLQHSPALAFA